MRLSSRANTGAKRIAWIEYQFGLRIHKRRSFDAGVNFAVPHLHAAYKHTSDNAFLSPGLTFPDLAVGVQTSQLGAGSRTAGRAIVCFSGAKHKISAIRPRNSRWRKRLHVVNLFAIVTRDAVGAQSLSYCPGEGRQLLNILEH